MFRQTNFNIVKTSASEFLALCSHDGDLRLQVKRFRFQQIGSVGLSVRGRNRNGAGTGAGELEVGLVDTPKPRINLKHLNTGSQPEAPKAKPLIPKPQHAEHTMNLI